MSNNALDLYVLSLYVDGEDEKNFRKYPDKPCYVRGVGNAEDPYEFFSRNDLERLVREFAEKHNLPTNKLDSKVRRLFYLLDWRHPATLLDECLEDHTIWDDEEWENATYE